MVDGKDAVILDYDLEVNPPYIRRIHDEVRPRLAEALARSGDVETRRRGPGDRPLVRPASAMILATGCRAVVPRFAESPLAGIDSIELATMEPPEPSALGERDAIVAVRAAAVGWVDLLMTSGQYQHMPKPPYTPGLECAGEVVWAGPAANLATGTRVIVDGLLAGPRSLGAYQKWGGFASYVVAPAEALVPIPAGLDFDKAAGLLGAYAGPRTTASPRAAASSPARSCSSTARRARRGSPPSRSPSSSARA